MVRNNEDSPDARFRLKNRARFSNQTRYSPRLSPLYRKSPIVSPAGHANLTDKDLADAQKHVQTLLKVSEKFLGTQFEIEINNTGAWQCREANIATIYKTILETLQKIESQHREIGQNLWKGGYGTVAFCVKQCFQNLDNAEVIELNEKFEEIDSAMMSRNLDIDPNKFEEIMELLYSLRDAVARRFYEECVMEPSNFDANKNNIQNFIRNEWETLKQMNDSIRGVYEFKDRIQSSMDQRFLDCLSNFEECFSTYRFVGRNILNLEEQDKAANKKFQASKAKEHHSMDASDPENEARMEWYRHILSGKRDRSKKTDILDVIETRGELYDTIGQMGTFDAMIP